MSSILYKYFSEMGIDVSWYKKGLYEKKSMPNSEFDGLRKIISECKQCILYKTLNKTVFGSGPSNSEFSIDFFLYEPFLYQLTSIPISEKYLYSIEDIRFRVF